MASRILLVEDNETNRDMLTRRLIRKGFDVDTAASGEEALEKLIDPSPDLILMDLSLPAIDGFEATRRIRSNNAARHIPIIALTANVTIEDRDRAISVGCDEFETKPVDLARLLEKIGACLAHLGSGATGRT